MDYGLRTAWITISASAYRTLTEHQGTTRIVRCFVHCGVHDCQAAVYMDDTIIEDDARDSDDEGVTILGVRG